MEFVDGMDYNFLEIELPPNVTGGEMVHHPLLKAWCFEAQPESHFALEHKLPLEDIWEENSYLSGTAQVLHLSLEWLHHNFNTFTAVHRPVGVTARACEKPALRALVDISGARCVCCACNITVM